MKRRYSLIVLVAILATFSVSAQNRVIRILQNGKVLQSYPVEMVDSIIVDNVIDTPSNLTATIENNHVVVKWGKIEGATYDLYRSADDTDYTLLATNLPASQYIDNTPIAGTNYYKVKARVNGHESELSSIPAIITMTDTGLTSGLYLGVMGFNSSISMQPIALLNPDTKPTYDAFIEALTIKHATILCYSVDQAINALQAASLPADISTVALVTFTDGLDQGSLMLDDRFDNDDDYLAAIKQRIDSETIAGKKLTAFSVGLRGQDVKNENEIAKFNQTMKLLASIDDNAKEVQNMAEVNAKFQEIAERLNRSTNIQTVTLKMPGISNGARIRFIFDNVANAESSELYIEGTFNLRSCTFTDVEYHGMTSTSSTTITGTVAEDLVSIYFTFENIQTSGNDLLSMNFVNEFYKTSTHSFWQESSEFDKKGQPDIKNEQSSAVVMLVLDCSSSLGNQFPTVQTNAKSFINTLCNSSNNEKPGDGETPEKPLPTIYSTTPIDLSLAVSFNGVRYYLTQEQYVKADLSDAVVEGVAIVTDSESFIISPNDVQSLPIESIEVAFNLYKDIIPTANQGRTISSKWSSINSLLDYLGGTLLDSNRFYYTQETKSATGDAIQDWVDGVINGIQRYTSCIHGSGGILYDSINTTPYVRGVINIK